MSAQEGLQLIVFGSLIEPSCIDVRRLDRLFAHEVMGRRRQSLIRPPEVAEAHAPLIFRWQLVPEP
jgi:hypothetical protein